MSLRARLGVEAHANPTNERREEFHSLPDTCVCVCVTHKHAHTHARTHTHTHKHTHINKYSYIYVYIYVCLTGYFNIHSVDM